MKMRDCPSECGTVDTYGEGRDNSSVTFEGDTNEVMGVGSERLGLERISR